MNERLKATMQKELVGNAGGWWFWISLGSFLFLLWIFIKVPGIEELTKEHTWPFYLIGILALAIGGAFRSILRSTKTEELEELDDDELRHEYEAMKRRELASTIVQWLIIAGVIAIAVASR